MIITDTFVYIHQPKTGGTFVTAALLRTHGVQPDADQGPGSGIHRPTVALTPYGQFAFHPPIHSRCRDIPEPHRNKSVLATIRSPYDWYVSHYSFGWWKGPRRVMSFRRIVPDLDKRYPGFPEVAFPDFVDFANRAYPVFPEHGFGGSRELASIMYSELATPLPGGTKNVGPMTLQFIDFYFRDPPAALSRLDERYVAAGDYKSDMFDVHFVRTDRLNSDLRDFLLRKGYRAEDVSFISELERVHPHGVGRPAHEKWEQYYTAELKEFVRRQERYLFELFPDFDV